MGAHRQGQGGSFDLPWKTETFFCNRVISRNLFGPNITEVWTCKVNNPCQLKKHWYNINFSSPRNALKLVYSNIQLLKNLSPAAGFRPSHSLTPPAKNPAGAYDLMIKNTRRIVNDDVTVVPSRDVGLDKVWWGHEKPISTAWRASTAKHNAINVKMCWRDAMHISEAYTIVRCLTGWVSVTFV